MNTPLRLLTAAFAGLAVASAALLVRTSEAAVVPVPVVLLPSVTVTGSREALRPEVVELPSVTVIGERQPGAPARVVLRELRPAR